MDTATVSLIGSGLLFIGSLITLLFNQRLNKAQTRNQEANTFSTMLENVTKTQEHADRLYDEKVSLEIQIGKLRNDLAAALVENVELKEKNANQAGYIQGITDPLIKLEEEQRAALRGGRRASDKLKGEN